MLHEIGVELQAALATQGCPFPVVDGPERVKSNTFGRERIVIEHDDGDTIQPTKLTNKNPQNYFTRVTAAKITIFAQNPVAGSLEFEHRRRAEHVLDMVLVALEFVASARFNEWQPATGRFLLPDDFAKTEAAGGAVYELKFTFDRGVALRTWAGLPLPSTTVGVVPIDNTVDVSATNGPDFTTSTTVPADAETP